jgi:hypothetical protein
MAKLDAGVELEIRLVPPSQEGPHDTYEISLWHDELIFSHQYNVEGWQLGHSEVLKIARAFQVAHRLVDQKVPVNLYDTGRRNTDAVSSPDMCIHLDVIWMHVILSAMTMGAREEPEMMIQCRLFLWTSPDEDYEPNQPPSEPLTRFVSEDFFIRPEEAIRFGAELEAECIAAQRERRRLDIEHFDDWIGFE